MLLEITRNADKPHIISYTRDDGTKTWMYADDFFVRHDLSHYAIEKKLGYTSAFMGMLNNGMDIKEFQVPISIRPLAKPIGYQHKILLIGSCFTEHIGDSLEELKFSVLQNPNGILFDPHSVCKSLNSYIQQKQYSEEDFFQLNEVWHSWNYHSRYSHTNLREAVRIVNESQQRAHEFLKTADWIIITLGSSFSYRLTSSSESSKVPPIGGDLEGAGVANCHRAPAQWFHKHLMTIDEVVSGLDDSLQRLFQFNPKLNIIFTVSPVRHIRDGVVDNNRSKARLI